jgi:endonuclease G
MKKLVLVLSMLVVSVNSYAWTQTAPKPLSACSADAPYGFPTGKKGVEQCRLAYATLNDTVAKLPIWTVWTITPTEAIGCIARTNAFVADASLPKGARAEPDDYAGTGYDKGHVAPDGDLSFDQQVEYESFLMTNMMPQSGGLNRGIWKLLETYTRGWAVQKNHNITVYAGPIYNATNPTIGANKVVVPHAFYKIVIDNTTKEVLSFIFEHKGSQGNDISVVQTSLQTVEQQTGLKFPLPAGAILNRATKDFPVDFGALTKAKQIKCK